MSEYTPRKLAGGPHAPVVHSFQAGASPEMARAVIIHHSRSPVVQTPVTLVVTSDRAVVRLGCVRRFEPAEPLLIVTGPAGGRRVAGAVFEDSDQDTAALRIESQWHSFDQRQSDRYICDLTARIVTRAGLWESAARVFNVSQGGLAFACHEVPPVPDVVVILNGDDELSLPCRVVSKRRGPHQEVIIGAKFVGLGTGEAALSAVDAHRPTLKLVTDFTQSQAPPPLGARIIAHRFERPTG